MGIGFSITIGVVLYGACLVALASVVCRARPEPPHWPTPLEVVLAGWQRQVHELGVVMATALQPVMVRTTEAMQQFAAAFTTALPEEQ